MTQEQASILGISDVHDGWKVSSVQIPLPDRLPRKSEADAPMFTVSGLYYRSIVQVIKAAFKSQDAMRYHYTPFKQFWSPNAARATGTSMSLAGGGASDQSGQSTDGAMIEDATQRIYDELYASDMWYNEHAKIQAHRRKDDLYENAIAGLMLWSDSTHLTDFGNASLWPIYLYFGNQSKYERCRPTAHACHHIAYLPEVLFSVAQDFLVTHFVTSFLTASPKPSGSKVLKGRSPALKH